MKGFYPIIPSISISAGLVGRRSLLSSLSRHALSSRSTSIPLRSPNLLFFLADTPQAQVLEDIELFAVVDILELRY